MLNPAFELQRKCHSLNLAIRVALYTQALEIFRIKFGFMTPLGGNTLDYIGVCMCVCVAFGFLCFVPGTLTACFVLFCLVCINLSFKTTNFY